MLKKLINVFIVVSIIGFLFFSTVDHALAGRNQLSPTEIKGLLQMREEEKLAHDCYITFYRLYGFNIFLNISSSEQHHMDAIKNLLDYYGLADPASNQVGIFNNPTLQVLYNDLTAWGSQSLHEALLAGAKIEEIDILDLEYYLSQTNKYNIQQVYGNLLHGSENHLRAFVSNLSTLYGEVYSPVLLAPERFQEIINGGCGGGCRNRGGH